MKLVTADFHSHPVSYPLHVLTVHDSHIEEATIIKQFHKPTICHLIMLFVVLSHLIVAWQVIKLIGTSLYVNLQN